jgi:hypothetical protein
MKILKSSLCLASLLLTATPTLTASAHIDMLSPKPLLHGKALKGRALKQAPFGAPSIDVAAAPAIEAKAGSTIEVSLDVYIFHPGTMTAQYTTDMTGGDLMPAMKVLSAGNAHPFPNLLTTKPIPCNRVKGKRGCQKLTEPFKMEVTLPDVEGDVILVVRQIMDDKLHFDPVTGDVNLSRVYYHQAAKFHLTK